MKKQRYCFNAYGIFYTEKKLRGMVFVQIMVISVHVIHCYHSFVFKRVIRRNMKVNLSPYFSQA